MQASGFMCWLVAGVAGFLGVAAAPDGALAQGRPATTTVRGEVVAAAGRWTADGRTIVTDAVVRTDAGDVDVVQLGGHADGKRMVLVHGPTQLAPGQRVLLTVHPSVAMAGGRTARPRWILDDVEVLDAGPGPAPAEPWVRTPTNKSKAPVYWAKSCVQITRAREGTVAVNGDAEQAVMQQSIAAWTTGSAACSYLDLVDVGTADSEVGNDGRNLIKFRDTVWCRPPVEGEDQHCFSHQASGITTLLFVDDPDNDRDGELIDVDVELNGVDFAISVNGQSESPASCQADLANTLVHELGHLLGLAHTCLSATDAPRTDGAGNPVPMCANTIDPVVTEATMYPFQNCGETSKVSLSDDDRAAICAIYPEADDPGACEGPDDLAGGCCDQGGGGARGAVVLALAAGLAMRRRRRRA